MTILHGGPAFPATTHNDTGRDMTDPFGAVLPPNSSAVYPGMTLRDYFAVHVDLSKTTIADAAEAEKFVGRNIPADVAGQLQWQFDFVARLRFMYADAMLKAREAQ